MADFRIFVSYSHQDAEVVGLLISLLRVTGDQIFRDIDNIPPGTQWRGALTNAIDSCETLLLFWCRHAAGSEEIRKEYMRALEQSKNIIPVLLDKTPLPEGVADYQGIAMGGIIGGHEEGYRTVEVPGVTESSYRQEWGLLVPAPDRLMHAALELKILLGQRLGAGT